MLTSVQVANKLTITTRTLWRLVKLGRAPQPIRFNRKLVRWSSKEVEEWMERERLDKD